MITQALVLSISGDLNDNEDGYHNQTWSEQQIREWVAEGVNLVFDKRPDLFMEKKVIPVTPCSVIQDTCDCGAIRRVLGHATKDGRLLSVMRKQGLESSLQWRGTSCRRATGKYKPTSYALDVMTDALYVWPEMPPHEEAYILVECAVRPDADSIQSEVDDAYVTAVKQWVLWRARSIDAEVSPAAGNAAQMHYKAFFDVLGVAEKATVVWHRSEKDASEPKGWRNANGSI
ncbi:hypothetical protein I7060_003847 [Escherichia coli]|nr:hypothetical protein [Escherichia coli]